MQEARLIFKENTPYSLDFEDFYFNSKDGVKESEFIYIKAYEYKQQNTFIIAELGFGIGLNFFLSLERFENSKIRPQNLFYVSLEAFYIEPELLREIYQKLGLYERFKPNLEQFLKFYPKKRAGIYRFYFKNCFLDLVFGEAQTMLKELDFKANVWFLDGFVPSKNPSMFNDEILKEVARLCDKNAKICTFSAASSLRKGLEKLNFKVEKVAGFKKRQMIRAVFKGFDDENKQNEGYFARPLNLNHSLNSKFFKNKKIAIIGAGIAGASLAYELSLRGFEIEVFEKENALACGASGNLSGILSALILKPEVSLAKFSENAFYEASRFYRQVLGLEMKGVFEFAYNELMLERFCLQARNSLFKIEKNHAFLEDGTTLKPFKIVQNLLSLSNAKLNLNAEFISFKLDEKNKFILNFKDKSELKGFDTLVFAMGTDIKSFLNYDEMKLSSVRGQVTHAKPFFNTPFALSAAGYLCPVNDDLQVFGASYDRLNQNKEPLKSDDEANLNKLSELLNSFDDRILKVLNLSQNELLEAKKSLKNIKITGSKVGFRSYSSDRFPIVGAFYDESFYKNAYKSLFWSKNKPQIIPPKALSLYFIAALGSRGFAYSILAARFVASLINDEPLGFEAKFIKEIHPARFLIRRLKKGL